MPGRSSSTGSEPDFIADPGPPFDLKHSPQAPTLKPDELAAQADERWQETTIKSLLTTQGNVAHHFLQATPEDHDTWKHTTDDLKAIAPPLTRILNRYDATRAAAAAGDEIALAAALAAYTGRNYTKRRRLIAGARDESGPQPITGVAADPDLGPEHDEEYARVHGLYEAPPALVPKGVRR